jgi:hypothetical protein
MEKRRLRELLILFATLACVPATGVLAEGKFDGAYAGTAVLAVGSNTAECKNYPTSISIVNDQLVFVSWGGRSTIKTTVAADGTFSGSGQHHMFRGVVVQTLVGKVAGNALDADIENPACKFHLFLKKTG